MRSVVSSRDYVTLDGIEGLTRLTQGETHADEVILEVIDLVSRTEGMLLTEAVLGDVQLVRETSETPSGIALDEDTRFEVSHE